MCPTPRDEASKINKINENRNGADVKKLHSPFKNPDIIKILTRTSPEARHGIHSIGNNAGLESEIELSGRQRVSNHRHHVVYRSLLPSTV